MNDTLKAELAKLMPKQKLKLADQLIIEAGFHEPPPGILREDGPGLEAELKRRMAHMDAHPEQWLTAAQLRASLGFGPRKK